LETADERQIATRHRRLHVGDEIGADVGLRPVLRQRVIHEIGLAIAGILIDVVGAESVLADGGGQPVPPARKCVGIGQLGVVGGIDAPVAGQVQQSGAGLERGRIRRIPKLVSLD